MKLQFETRQIPCMQQVDFRQQVLEQMQEVRLSEAMPDIGRVICSWGQVIIRGKEWHGKSAGISGGVMTWTMYEPEDGSKMQTVESWIPFNMKWETEDPDTSGVILCSPFLKSVDARSTAARKLSVRIAVMLSVKSMVYDHINLCEAQELPEDIQLLQHTYPVKIPKEAGEKSFDLDEILELPSSCPSPEKIVYYRLTPVILDQKVMTDKMVFRGTARLHILYYAENGTPAAWNTEIPFSQYAELDGEYNQDAETGTDLFVTNLELETENEEELHLKAGIAGQYVICERENIQTVEDMYSYKYEIEPDITSIKIPAVLDEQSETENAEIHIPLEATEIVDLTFYPEQPQCTAGEETVSCSTAGDFQILYRDLEGSLQCAMQYWENTIQLPASADGNLQIQMLPGGCEQAELNGGQANIREQITRKVLTTRNEGFPVTTGLTTGEQEKQTDVSLIVCKKGEQTLWQLAKSCNSTVDAIKALNPMEADPQENTYLLIPVLK